MKIPKDIRDKRISEISNIYNNALNDIQIYNEKIYRIINNKQKTKIEKRQQVKETILDSLTDTMSYILKEIETLYPNSYDKNAKIKLEKLLYNKDGLTLNQRINNWFKEEENEQNLAYHMRLILRTETEQIIPRIIQTKLTRNTVYVEILEGGGECSTGICSEYVDEQAYPEDEVELPPYHPDCGCQAIFYDIDDLKELLEDKI